MHLLSTRAGGYVDDAGQGVVRLPQTAGDIVVLSAADTTLSLLAEAAQALPLDHPTVRLANLMWLRQPASVDMYVEDVLAHARVVVIDHLGAPADWAYVVEQASALARRRGQWLALFSGDDQEDPQLLLRGTAPAEDARFLWRCLRQGGRSNAQRFFQLLRHRVWGDVLPPGPPQELPAVFAYQPQQPCAMHPGAPVALVLFYRAHAQAGNTAPFDALMHALSEQGLNPLAMALDSLKSPSTMDAVRNTIAQQGVDLVLNATSFAVGAAQNDAASEAAWLGDVVVLQLITAGVDRQRWQADPHGLPPRDLAMQVVLPEIDGRIATRAISFKGLGWRCERAQIDVVRYLPDPERIAFVAELARRWCALRRTPASQQRLALVLANYPQHDGRLANGVGLDTPASVVRILQALQAHGYGVQDAPSDAQSLMERLQQCVTNDVSANDWRPAGQSLSLQEYRLAFAQLPDSLQQAMLRQWGLPEQDPMVRQGRIMIPGLRLGRVFVGIQPARGWQIDLARSYHDADLVPPHAYVAFYVWVRRVWAADAIVHVGKHGNLEWLPGKSVALGPECWPDAVFGPWPHLYPFIVNDPGEGCQAKRRAQAVIIDHLMPPLTRAETYGALQHLERQMDEYAEALLIDPTRAKRLRSQMVQQVLTQGLHVELGLTAIHDESMREQLLQRLDTYLCELKEAQIRGGLHVFGMSPQGQQRIDTLLALARFPRGSEPRQDSLLRALAQDLGLQGFDPLDADWGQAWSGPRPDVLQAIDSRPWRHAGHTRERLERLAQTMLASAQVPDAQSWPRSRLVIQDILENVAPKLDASGSNEMMQLLRGLQGRFVPPGPSGAPSRGRVDVLPTGRNFYAVDTRAVPTPTAYATGALAAQRLIERHVQDHGQWPTAVGLSVWGTSTMRSGGEDIAQALALLGVRPRWAEGSGRVIDVEVIPAALLGRPRVDVMLRISGFFRDAFPGLIDLFDTAVKAVAQLPADDESDEMNPIRVRVRQDQTQAQERGMPPQLALRQATWRIFGPRPQGYGTGLQQLLEDDRWQGLSEIAQAYLRAGAYAYGQGEHGALARAPFEAQVARLDAVVHNQDNREHDILDSDDYYQFQGGLAASVEHLRGTAAALYHGDLSQPGAPRIRSLAQELSRVVRSRAVNPKWLSAMRRHGYKGAAEMAATVDFLFAFDATTGQVADHHYALVTDAYLNDPINREFLLHHNPQALRQIGQRLLQAAERGLWADADAHIPSIRQALLEAEMRLEGSSLDDETPFEIAQRPGSNL